MFDKTRAYILKKICDLNPETSETEKEEIEYGLHILFSETIKISALWFSAIIIGVFPYILAMNIVFFVLRLYLGGIHAKSHIACLFSSLAIFYSVLGLSVISPIWPIISLLIATPVTFFISYRHAPADLPEKPIVSKKQRSRLRRNGMLSLAVFYLIAVFVPHPWANIIIYCCFVQSLLMTPVVYKITKNKYGYEGREMYEDNAYGNKKNLSAPG